MNGVMMASLPAQRQRVLPPDSSVNAPTGLRCEARPIAISAIITGRQINTTNST